MRFLVILSIIVMFSMLVIYDIAGRIKMLEEQCAKDGGVCERCGKQYDSLWRAPDGLWEKVMGTKRGWSGLFCMNCFDKMAQDKGIELEWECDYAIWQDGEGKE